MAPAGGCWGGAVAAAGAARRVPVLLLLGVLSARRVPVPLLLLGVLSAAPRPGAQASEHYTPLSLLKQELQHRQQQEAPAGGGCSPQSGDWGDQHSAECAESPFLNLHGADCEPRASAPRDSPLSLHAEKALSQAKSVAEQKRFPFAPDNDSTSEELAIAYVLIGSGLYDEAIRHFSTMLQILSPLGRISEAVSDLTRAIQLQPSARLYRHRGTLYFMSEDYATAHEDPQLSLELNRNQPIAMLYKGLTFFHRGLLKVNVPCLSHSVEWPCLYFVGGKNLVEFRLACLKTMSRVYRIGLFQKVVCVGIFAELPCGPEGRGERLGRGRHALHPPRVVPELSTHT